MKWIEIITLRSPSKINGQFIDELLKGASECDSLIDMERQRKPWVKTQEG